MTAPEDKASAPPKAEPRTVTTGTLLEHASVADMMTLCAGEAGLKRLISHPRVQKSGLVLAGHRHGMVPSRVQILGETEVSYLDGFTAEERAQRLGVLFTAGPSMVVLSRGVEPYPELVRIAESTGSPLVLSQPRSSGTIHALHRALDELLAPTESIHGVLVVVHGLGLLLVGPSGIGKSETALSLLERGHRLVADDRVTLIRRPDDRIVGAPPHKLRHHIELRGIGIVNVRDLFGATAVRDSAAIDLVVELCRWDDAGDFDRLGLDDLSHRLLDLDLAMVRIPVRPGRNMAVILEVAARNQLLKLSGRHAAREFVRSLQAAAGLEQDEP